MTRRTIDQVREQARRTWRGDEFAPRFKDLSDMPGWTFVTSSKLDDCLTHVLRYAIDYRDTRWPRVSGHTQCNMGLTVRPVELADVTFVCRRCLAACEVYGVELPIAHLIPDDGCCASNGKRRGRRGAAAVAGGAS